MDAVAEPGLARFTESFSVWVVVTYEVWFPDEDTFEQLFRFEATGVGNVDASVFGDSEIVWCGEVIAVANDFLNTS